MQKRNLIFMALAIFVVTFLAGQYIIAVTNSVDSELKSSDTSSAQIISPPTSNEVEQQINKFRKSKNLPAFNSDVAALDEAAQARAEAMCHDNDWSHANDWAVLDQYYTYSWAGENLYFGFAQEDQARVAVRDWVASPTHLKNITSDYTEIGVAVKSCPGFQGEPTAVIITNYFGVPL